MNLDAAAGSRAPVIVTDDQDIADQLLRLCAAAGVHADVVGDPARVRVPWPAAAAVMVGDDVAEAVARLDLPRRAHVLLVSQARDAGPLFRLAFALKADEIAVLPGAEPHLVERLGDLADGSSNAVTVGVIGGCGGAGASTFAAALALSAARAGLRSMLIDADPLGGGVELVVGCEDRAGLRWPEVAETRGRVSAVAFRDALPAIGGLAVLSWNRAEAGQPEPETMGAMVRAAQRGSHLVVVDLPRHLDETATHALLLSDQILLVATPEVKAVASALRMLTGLRRLCPDVRVVVRDLPARDLTAQTVATALGLPLAGQIASKRCVGRAVNDGLGPLARGSLERSCRPIVAALVAPSRRAP